MIFRNPQFLWLLLLLPLFVILWRWRGLRVTLTALLLRLGMVTLLVLALANPSFGYEPPPSGPLVVLIDQSDSLTSAGQAQLRNEAAQIAADAGERATVLWFGENVVVADDTSVAQANDATSQTPTTPAILPDQTASNLAEALRDARELLTPTGGEIVLLSDGYQTEGDALREAQLAAEAGLIVNVWPSAPVDLPEVSITSVTAPRTLRVGEEYPISIVVDYRPSSDNDAPINATLRLSEGTQLLNEQAVTIPPGGDQFTFRHTAITPGIAQLQAEIVPENDTFVQNNRLGATALVAPPPTVLLVEGRVGSARDLATALDGAGVETQTMSANNLPTKLSELARYDGMVLIDVPAASLSLDQMASVREFVRSEGRGVVAIGGRNSFGLGAYKDTPLEETLPVSMDPPPRPERTEIALLLIMDRSASMTAALGVSKFDMAKEAAILSIESLQSDDRIGILAFDTGQLWVVPFQQIGEGLSQAQIQQQIINLASGGGTDIEQALVTGLPALANQPTKVRHAVLLTDGRSFTSDRAAYQQLVDTARAQNITLSTIAIGQDADTNLLDQLARWGGGRYYFADTPEDIPRLTLLESEIARADPTVEETFQARLAEVHPLVRDFNLDELPPLDGYVATTPKPEADVVLRSPEDDPVLVSWQYGLGRAVAWTPSVDAPWADSWPNWNDYGRFWAQVVRYTLPEPDSGPIQVRFEPIADGTRMVIDALQPGGSPLDFAQVNAQVTLPDGTQRDFPVSQSGPGQYTRDMVLTTPGAYAVAVSALADGVNERVDVGYVHQAPAEYRQQGDDQTQLQGQPLLEAIAAATGGSIEARLPGETIDEAEAAEVAAGPLALWPWLLGAALLLWITEIAVRRGLFIRR